MNGLNVNNRVQGFDIIDADTLMTKPLPKNRFLVEALVPQGVKDTLADAVERYLKNDLAEWTNDEKGGIMSTECVSTAGKED